MIELSKRMLMAANMVRNGSVVADIGTDHAYLPTYLILKGVSPRALACDLRRGPLDNARKTAVAYGVEDKIKLLLSDGFDELSADDADDFVICGMGGTLMDELVSRTAWLKDERKRLIVQPQSHAEDIRKFFVENGFDIVQEDACIDHGKLYCAMYVEYTGETKPKPLSYVYTGELPMCNKPEAKLYLQKVLDRLKIKAQAQAMHGTKENAEYLDRIIDEMERTINGIE